MANKELLFDREAQEKLLSGVNQVANAVRITLGAKGRNVMFSNHAFGIAPRVTNDGVTIAKEIKLKDPFEDMGAQLIIEVAQKTNETSGDGTTTATILAQAIIAEGLKNVAAGANSIEIKRGIELGVAKVVGKLKKMATPIVDQKDIEKVATVSSGDPEIGKIIGEVFSIIGKDGIISVEESGHIGLSKDIVEGIKFPKGLFHPYLVNNKEKMVCEIEDPVILITDKKITMTDEIVPILSKIAQSGIKEIAIIADDIHAEALNAIITNKLRGVIDVCAVPAPGFGENKKELLGDIAAITGATLITSEAGIELENFEIGMLGKARRIIADQYSTTIVDGKGDKKAIKERENQIRTLLKKATDGNQKMLLTDRLAKITGGFAVIGVGAISEIELKEKKFKLEDAVEAAKAAIEEGIIPGGGIALLNCLYAVDYTENQEVGTGMEIINRAILYPIKQIASNAGENGDAIIKEIKHRVGMLGPVGGEVFGWNCKTNEYGSMINMGIIDPVKVTRCALENAASVAMMILTTEVLITDEVVKA